MRGGRLRVESEAKICQAGSQEDKLKANHFWSPWSHPGLHVVLEPSARPIKFRVSNDWRGNEARLTEGTAWSGFCADPWSPGDCIFWSSFLRLIGTEAFAHNLFYSHGLVKINCVAALRQAVLWRGLAGSQHCFMRFKTL